MPPEPYLSQASTTPCPRLIDSRPFIVALADIRQRIALLNEMMAGQPQTQVLGWAEARLESALHEARHAECQYLSTEEAAVMLGLASSQALTQRARNNRIPNARKEGGKWVIPRVYIDDELRVAA